MESLDGPEDTVHPEVRAHVNSLVSALAKRSLQLGGISADDDGQYQLGDDALEVLRDIKRWIRFYDEKTNRMDVARCIYDASLVEGDLLPILAQWPESIMDNKFRSRLALACFEIMVPLTWPMERDKERMTVNHHRHMPVLEWAQVQYKKAIINFDAARILHAAVRAALPAMATPISDRSTRDESIIKLVLFFLRNVAMIHPSSSGNYECDESQISRSATVDAFSYQDIFIFLLTIASNMGEDFKTEDVIVMEIIFHLVKRVDVKTLFMHEQQLNGAKARELAAMMNTEASMLKAYNRRAPTRHNRFGTMVWVKRDDGKMASLSGQDALADVATRIQKMDASKTFKPPRRGRRQDDEARDLGPPARLNTRANDQLRSFVKDFLDSGFNPLFQHVRRSIDREASIDWETSHVLHDHKRQFFYLVAWFLEAEQTRRRAEKGAARRPENEVGSFNLVAGVLNQEMFITLQRALLETYENKDWPGLTSVMRCYTQILLTVQEMAESGHDEEIAENVLNRLFYEESTQEALARIAKSYKDQGFDYLDAATELVHHFLRILEAYSKQNTDMHVRSRKRSRKRKKQAAQQAGNENDLVEEPQDESAEDEAAAQKDSRDRKFDFHKFSSHFTQQGVVNTFTALTKYYRDLTDAQLKRAHRYFYRLAFKQDMAVMLFRVDIIHLLYNMVKGPEPLDKSSKMFGEWEELVKQLLHKCFKKIQERPELIVEMLFSKFHGTAFYLEYGYEQQTLRSKRQAKPGAELEFKYTEELDRQIAIVVGAMLDRNEGDHIGWVKEVLAEAESERQSWTAAQEDISGGQGEESAGHEEPKKPPLFHVRSDTPSRRKAVFKNPRLRLLMTVCGFQRLGSAPEETVESSWCIPGDVSAARLKDTLHHINQAEFSPPTFDDGDSAEKQLRRKAVPRRRAAFDDDDDDGLVDGLAFPTGGPTVQKAIDKPARLKKTRRSRRRQVGSEEPDEAALDERARKRQERELERARHIKSALYVRDGDDEFDSDEDAAFFARERAIAERAKRAAETAASAHAAPGKRKSDVASLSFARSDDDVDDEPGSGFVSRASRSPGAASQASQTAHRDREIPSKRRKASRGGGHVVESDDEPEPTLADNADSHDDMDVDADAHADVDMPMQASLDAAVDQDGAVARAAAPRRPRVRGGFVIDNDDDDD